MMFNELGEIYSNECEEKKFENILEEMLERSKIDIYNKIYKNVIVFDS